MQSPSNDVRLHDITLVPVTQIKRDPTNPNVMSQAQMDGLRNSFRRFGYLQPVILDKDHVIVDGEHRLDIYLESGRTEIPCYVLDLDSEGKRLLRQTMNKLHGTHDRGKEADDLKVIYDAGKLGDLAALTGYGQETLIRFIERSYNLGIIHQDSIPSLEETPPIVQKGELWRLGRHALMCGDSLDKDDMSTLLGTVKVDQLNTDPPYGVDYAGKNRFLNDTEGSGKGNRIQTPIENDSIQDYRTFFTSFLGIIPFAEYNTAYVFMQGPHLHDLRMGMQDAGLTWSDYLVWMKNRMVLGRKDYRQAHEFIVYGWRGKHKPMKDKRSTILQYSSAQVNDMHPTQKPIDLIVSLIRDGSQEGAVVYDPFLGSGTTLIACEQTERTCYGMEIEPRYCDVIIKRWEKLTGQKAEKVT